MSNEKIISGWRLLSKLGRGGNGEVWRAERHGVTAALKLLFNRDPSSDSYKRFAHEVRLLEELGDKPGVLRILDAHVPERPSRREQAWLAMPIATGVRSALGDFPPLERVIEAVAAFADTLAALAEQGISHRDLKPENLYRYENQWVVGDFGLADYPGKEEITEAGRAIGPRFYIAPEMVVDPINASGHPADVWSLGKTLWVLATSQNFPPPHPQPATNVNTSLYAYTKQVSARSIDHLIERATRLEPSSRPSMRELAGELRVWLNNRDTPTTAVADLSTVALQLISISDRYRETADRKAWSEAIAKEIEDELLAVTKSIAEIISSFGIEAHASAFNPNSFRGVEAAAHQKTRMFAAQVAIPDWESLYLRCWIGIRVFEDGLHELVACQLIGKEIFNTLEVLWSEALIVEPGSAMEEAAVTKLTGELNGRLHGALSRFTAMLSEIAKRKDTHT